ncbi:MAG: DUF6055 domain-containing protein [Bacteroidales bacterium]|nr:DUF6055 domain-containing protein [Bacteroidales bacterium]
MRLFRLTLTALAVLWGGFMYAQETTGFYGVKGDKRQFNLTARTFQLKPDDRVEFSKVRVTIWSADGSRTSAPYTNIEYFTFENPLPTLYRPSYLNANDFENESSRFCWTRSMESEHFVVFWEAGFGNDPTKAGSKYRFNPKTMLQQAENIYRVNTEQLGFLAPGSKKTAQQYKIMMFVSYTTEWAAYGSGQDDKVGTLDVNPDAANSAPTVAHEIGHTFQYIIGCELGSSTHGWRYGFGAGASGGCGWWEQCAQWQAYKVYPEQKFTDGYSYGVYGASHLHPLHEEPRYSNFFIQDWWCQLHGEDFIGRLWQEAQRPEDPIETYMRMNSETLDDFARDMYGYATHAITWDIDGIRELGKTHQNAFKTELHRCADDPLAWEVDASNCPQNFGFNVIELRVPDEGTEVAAQFKGEAGVEGYRAINVDKAGWRYGFVAQKTDGNCVYGDMFAEADGRATFTIPEQCEHLWFVVLGAPTEYWRHPWDDSDTNDEQWPYRVRFDKTDLPGEYYFPEDYVRCDTTVVMDITMPESGSASLWSGTLKFDPVCQALGISLSKLKTLSAPNQKDDDDLTVYGLDNDGSASNVRLSDYAYYYGYDKNGHITSERNDLKYYIMWSPAYNQTLYVGELEKDAIEADKTYLGGVVIKYRHTDGNVYTATVKLNIHK